LRAILLVLALLFQEPPRTGVVEGIVLRARTEISVPLVNARVVLERNATELVTRTDSNGRFVFAQLLPGRYRLRVTKDGYVRQEYPHSAMGATGVPIDLSAGQQIRDIVFRLDPAPTISGVIRDGANSPIANIIVQALRRGYDTRGNRTLTLLASAKSDDRGSYRLYWLDPGEYFVAAVPPPPRTVTPQVAPAPTYFPGFPAIDDAKPVRLEIGREANGMDIRLAQSPLQPVHGAVTNLVKGGYAASNVVLSAPEDGAGVARFQTRSIPDPKPPERDNYRIPSVPSGSYILTAVSGNDQASRRILVRPSALFLDGLVVDLAIGPGVSISGRLVGVADFSDQLRTARVGLDEIDTALPSPPQATVAPDGAFVVSGVQPGQYSVTVSGLPGDLYVRTASVAGVNALEKPIPIAYGRSPDQLGIEVGTDGGRISGVVYSQENIPFFGAQVTLVPEGDNRRRLDYYRTTVSALDGTFAIRGIVPGDYRLFGWDDLEPNAHLNAEFMQSYQQLGTLVRVEPGRTHAVPLRVIPLER
jgi:Carboxypeptidase regulatory-like domain